MGAVKRTGKVQYTTQAWRSKMPFNGILQKLAGSIVTVPKKKKPKYIRKGYRHALTEDQVRQLRLDYVNGAKEYGGKIRCLKAWAAKTGCSLDYLLMVADGQLRGGVI